MSPTEFFTSPEVTAWVNGLAFVGMIITLVSAIFAIRAWMQAQEAKTEAKAANAEVQKFIEHLDDEIRIQLRCGGRYIDVPSHIERRDYGRNEVLGRIGMVPTKTGKRYQIKSLNTEEFINKLHEIRTMYGDRLLEISCTDEELDQFDVTISTM